MRSDDLLSYQHLLQIRAKGNKKEVYDAARRKWVALAPEEYVRQLWLFYLQEKGGYPLSLIRTELGLVFNEQIKRCDIVVFRQEENLKPHLIIECKAPTIALTDKVLMQTIAYNMVLQANFCIISNGIKSFLYCLDYRAGTWEEVPHLPLFSSQ
jgi:hypothetical protein